MLKVQTFLCTTNVNKKIEIANITLLFFKTLAKYRVLAYICRCKHRCKHFCLHHVNGMFTRLFTSVYSI